MIYITDEDHSIRVEGEEVSRHYPYVGVLTIPKNTVLMVLDEKSNMVVFKSASNYDTWFTGILGNIYIEGVLVTRDNIVDKFNAVAYELPSGTGSTDVDLSNYYTKDEVDYLISTVDGEGGGGVGCCLDIIKNQEAMISMLESVTNDQNIINNMLDAINNETLECDYAEANILNDIIGDEITC